MDKSITNLLRLIDSGRIENIRMAAQMSVNLPREYQWLRKYLEAFEKLPPQYASWYSLYSEIVKYGSSGAVHVLEPYTFLPSMNSPTAKVHKFYTHEIAENVANELHFMMFRLEPYKIIRDIETTEHAMLSHYRIPKEEVKANHTISLASKLLGLLRKKF